MRHDFDLCKQSNGFPEFGAGTGSQALASEYYSIAPRIPPSRIEEKLQGKRESTTRRRRRRRRRRRTTTTKKKNKNRNRNKHKNTNKNNKKSKRK